MNTPDERIEIVGDGECLAACSLWWSKSVAKTGFLGAYESRDARAAQAMFARARRTLQSAGCSAVVGPIDGSTWHRYRLVTERGTRAPFFGEPDNPDSHVVDFRANGLEPVARYFSAEEAMLGSLDARSSLLKERFASRGVVLRELQLERFAEELHGIHSVALAAFSANPYYTPVDFDTFCELYEPLRPTLDPRLIRIAEHEGKIVAFAFGYWDGETVIGKTQARLPGRHYAGLTAVMIDDLRRNAGAYGARSLVHALIGEGNIARNGSLRHARPFRRYDLFGAHLA